MKNFENASVEQEGNSYFDCAVTSRTVNFKQKFQLSRIIVALTYTLHNQYTK